MNDLTGKGLFIYDIKKIRDFICWKREVLVARESEGEKDAENRKGDS